MLQGYYKLPLIKKGSLVQLVKMPLHSFEMELNCPISMLYVFSCESANILLRTFSHHLRTKKFINVRDGASSYLIKSISALNMK